MGDELVTRTLPPTNVATNVPMPSKEAGQRSINITDLFITRWTPPWSRPPSLPAYTWRAWVLNQPVATVCREMLITMLTGLDWTITARDSDKKEDLAPTMDYYNKLLNHGGYYLDTDWTGLLEWVCGDLLDIPFGGAVEVGRRDDSPKGRVVWLRPLDGGTLYPTLNKAFPVVQYYQGYSAVMFPKHAIARTYMSPRPEIFREGWGIAPPEKIYFALDLLNRGDKYYANLLLDVPPAGILDLGDMEKTSAQEWINEFRTFVANTTDAFRIPVLYEHNNEVKFLPFGKVPNDIMFDHITLKYAALVASAYGLQLNDIGLQTTSRSGETLAGAIRATTQTMRSGMAKLKMKIKYFIEQILPDTLQFDWVDFNADSNVAMGRARLASATAFNALIQAGAFSAQEIRSQMLFDGLLSVSIPNERPKDAVPQTPPGSKTPERPGSLGHGTLPSEGGEGELRSIVIKRSDYADKRTGNFVKDIVLATYPRLKEFLSLISDDDLMLSKSMILDGIFSDEAGVVQLISELSNRKSVLGIDMKSVRSLMGEVTGVPDEKKKKLEEKLKGSTNQLVSLTAIKSLADVMWEQEVAQINDLEMNWNESEEPVEGDTQEAFDGEVVNGYDYIVEEVKSRTLKSLPATIEAWILSEIEEMNRSK